MVSPDQTIAVTMSSASGWPASVPSVRQAVSVLLVVSSSVYSSSSGRQFYRSTAVRLVVSLCQFVSLESSFCRQFVSLYQLVWSSVRQSVSVGLVANSLVYISSSCQSSVRQSISVSLVVTVRQSGCISSSCPQFVSLLVRLVLSSLVSVYWSVRLVVSSSACNSSVLSSVLPSVSVRLVVSLWKPLAASFYLDFFFFFFFFSVFFYVRGFSWVGLNGFCFCAVLQCYFWTQLLRRVLVVLSAEAVFWIILYYSAKRWSSAGGFARLHSSRKLGNSVGGWSISLGIQLWELDENAGLRIISSGGVTVADSPVGLTGSLCPELSDSVSCPELRIADLAALIQWLGYQAAMSQNSVTVLSWTPHCGLGCLNSVTRPLSRHVTEPSDCGRAAVRRCWT